MNLIAALLATVAVSALPVDSIAQSLKSNPVYVASGIPGTDSETAGVLKSQLGSGDNIVIVMLPATAATHPVDVAKEINDRLGGKKIVGLSVGETVSGYSTVLPSGVASESMERASTVSTTTVETLGTFIQNVHDWQKAHPAAVASKPTAEKGRSTGITILIGLAVLVFLLILLLLAVPMLFGGDSEDDVKLKKSPEPVRDELNDLLETRPKIDDALVAETLTQICRDTEAFFQRKQADTSDTEAFEGHLRSLNQVMTQYVDIQNNPRYFEDPDALLQNGAQAASAFGEYVLDVVRRDGRRGLTNFRVDTDILSAQRYR